MTMKTFHFKGCKLIKDKKLAIRLEELTKRLKKILIKIIGTSESSENEHSYVLLVRQQIGKMSWRQSGQRSFIKQIFMELLCVPGTW